MVDASVAVKWVVEEEHTAQAVRVMEAEGCHAPAHWQAEAVNALWAKVFRRELDSADAGERMTALLRAPVHAAGITGLLPRAFAIAVAHSVTIYDALYVALAERLTIPLVTADGKLVRRMPGAVASGQILWIGDIDLNT